MYTDDILLIAPFVSELQRLNTRQAKQYVAGIVPRRGSNKGCSRNYPQWGGGGNGFFCPEGGRRVDA